MKLRTVMASALLAAGVAVANAAPVGYDGAVFDLAITPVAGSQYSLTYTADFTAFKNSSGDKSHLLAINWKLLGTDLKSVDLVDTNALGSWGTPMLNGDTNANGCKSNGNGGQGYLCLEAANWLAQPTEGSLFWTFDVTLDRALSFAQLENLGNPILARFAYADKNGNAKQSGLMSCVTGNLDRACSDFRVNSPLPVDPFGPSDPSNPSNPSDPVGTVPEPGVAALLSLGVIGLLFGQRRRKTA